MGATFFYDKEHYPPNEHGRADEQRDPTLIQVFVSSFYGDHQIFLRINEGSAAEQTIHLTKLQARELAAALETADQRIGYDNTKPIPDAD
ncbi:MAG: hypothetical protein WCI02_19160 [Planctomycetota bacterium]|jgi:hypothetical protein